MSLEDNASSAAILASLAAIKQQLETFHSDMKEMKSLLRGEGDNPGLQIRVDRLEQATSKNNAYHMLWAGSVISGIVAWIISKLN